MVFLCITECSFVGKTEVKNRKKSSRHSSRKNIINITFIHITGKLGWNCRSTSRKVKLSIHQSEYYYYGQKASKLVSEKMRLLRLKWVSSKGRLVSAPSCCYRIQHPGIVTLISSRFPHQWRGTSSRETLSVDSTSTGAALWYNHGFDAPRWLTVAT